MAKKKKNKTSKTLSGTIGPPPRFEGYMCSSDFLYEKGQGFPSGSGNRIYTNLKDLKKHQQCVTVSLKKKGCGIAKVSVELIDWIKKPGD